MGLAPSTPRKSQTNYLSKFKYYFEGIFHRHSTIQKWDVRQAVKSRGVFNTWTGNFVHLKTLYCSKASASWWCHLWSSSRLLTLPSVWIEVDFSPEARWPKRAPVHNGGEMTSKLDAHLATPMWITRLSWLYSPCKPLNYRVRLRLIYHPAQ